jgi:hypothetical protein
MEGLADTEHLAAFMKANEEDDQRAWRVPPVLLLVGQTEEARAIVQAELQALAGSGGWADFYREFARRFVGYVDARDANV